MALIAGPAPLGLRSLLKVERRQGDASGSEVPLFRRKRRNTPCSADFARRRPCVQAVETPARLESTSKRSFAEPQWLFPANIEFNFQSQKTEESGYGTSSPSSQLERNPPLALYYVTITTAHVERSRLSEPTSGILLSIIGENGNTIMYKIPSNEEFRCLQNGQIGEAISDFAGKGRFERGALDLVTVVGPDLGRLAALWIAPETGTWRIERVSLTVIPWLEELVVDEKLSIIEIASLAISDRVRGSAGDKEWKGTVYGFESREELLGEDAWISAVELKPSLIEEILDPVELQGKTLRPYKQVLRSSQTTARLRDQSMNEYENLKLSLLGFDSLLVGVGTASLAALGQGKPAEGFAVGGVGGFCYLLLLQKAVDRLPGSETVKVSAVKRELGDTSPAEQPIEGQGGEEENRSNFSDEERATGNLDISKSDLGGRRSLGSPVRVALVASVVLVLGRLAQGGAVSTVSPPELLAGVVGFLTSKIAVVLAALKPISSTGDEKN